MVLCERAEPRLSLLAWPLPPLYYPFHPPSGLGPALLANVGVRYQNTSVFAGKWVRSRKVSPKRFKFYKMHPEMGLPIPTSMLASSSWARLLRAGPDGRVPVDVRDAILAHGFDFVRGNHPEYGTKLIR